jgi:hypothetical protein
VSGVLDGRDLCVEVCDRDSAALHKFLAFNDMDFDPYAGKPNFTVSSYVELVRTNPVK